jgi:cytochrome P450
VQWAVQAEMLMVADHLQTLTELWRRGRKLMHTLTMPAAATSYQPLQVYESERLLFDLLLAPDKYEQLFERYAGGVIMRLAYSKTIETGDEAYIQDALRVVHTVERVASPGAYLVDTFPSLLYLPRWLAPFKREAAKLHDFEITLFRGLIGEVREKMRQGKTSQCFSTTFLERQDEFGLSDDEGAYVIGTLFEAGAGTTAAALCSFCLAMVHYPEWQIEMQNEVDEIIGDGAMRMPDFEDIAALPKVRAVIKEVLRWRPVTAGGVPHQLVKDDVYDGLFFPAGTNVHANQW